MTDALAPDIILNFIRNKRSFFIGVDAVRLGLVLLDALVDALSRTSSGCLVLIGTTTQYLLNISTIRRAEGCFACPDSLSKSWKKNESI